MFSLRRDCAVFEILYQVFESVRLLSRHFAFCHVREHSCQVQADALLELHAAVVGLEEQALYDLIGNYIITDLVGASLSQGLVALARRDAIVEAIIGLALV